jgi:hypothetical protein
MSEAGENGARQEPTASPVSDFDRGLKDVFDQLETHAEGYENAARGVHLTLFSRQYRMLPMSYVDALPVSVSGKDAKETFKQAQEDLTALFDGVDRRGIISGLAKSSERVEGRLKRVLPGALEWKKAQIHNYTGGYDEIHPVPDIWLSDIDRYYVPGEVDERQKKRNRELLRVGLDFSLMEGAAHILGMEETKLGLNNWSDYRTLVGLASNDQTRQAMRIALEPGLWELEKARLGAIPLYGEPQEFARTFNGSRENLLEQASSVWSGRLMVAGLDAELWRRIEGVLERDASATRFGGGGDIQQFLQLATPLGGAVMQKALHKAQS